MELVKGKTYVIYYVNVENESKSLEALNFLPLQEI